MRRTTHWLMRTLVMLIALTPALTVSAQATDKKSPERPEIRVIGLVGEPTHIAADKTESVAVLGDRLDYGSRLKTDNASRAAITVRWSRDVPGESLDLVMVGPESDVTFASNDALDTLESSSRAVVVMVRDGIVRVIARAPGDATGLYLKEGPREARCLRTDVVVATEPATKSATYYCRFGQVGIRQASRLMLLNSGLMREISRGEPKGAKRFATFQWRDLENKTDIDDVVTEFASPVANRDDDEARRRLPKSPGRIIEPTGSDDAAAQKPVEQQDEYEYVRLVTSKGDIDLALNRTRAPITVANFLRYVDDGFYDGTIFHRVIPNFMIQGGGLTPELAPKATYSGIENEWRNGLKNVRGSVAMARRGGAADSATSQFFINVVDNPGLDQPQQDGAAYAVFGRVIDGMEVVDAIRKVETTTRGGRRDVPVETVLIKDITRIEEPKETAPADGPDEKRGSDDGE